MFDYRACALRNLARIGPSYLPFADVASDEVPLSRLLRLSLFQVTVGMALVQATAAGIGIALAGIVRDGLVALPGLAGSGVAGPYNAVFALEALILLLAIAVALPLARSGGNGGANDRNRTIEQDDETNTVEVA